MASALPPSSVQADCIYRTPLYRDWIEGDEQSGLHTTLAPVFRRYARGLAGLGRIGRIW